MARVTATNPTAINTSARPNVIADRADSTTCWRCGRRSETLRLFVYAVCFATRFHRIQRIILHLRCVRTVGAARIEMLMLGKHGTCHSCRQRTASRSEAIRTNSTSAGFVVPGEKNGMGGRQATKHISLSGLGGI